MHLDIRFVSAGFTVLSLIQCRWVCWLKYYAKIDISLKIKSLSITLPQLKSNNKRAMSFVSEISTSTDVKQMADALTGKGTSSGKEEVQSCHKHLILPLVGFCMFPFKIKLCGLKWWRSCMWQIYLYVLIPLVFPMLVQIFNAFIFVGSVIKMF